MPRSKIHMQDQVGRHKVDEIMSHYDYCSIDMWTVKFMVVGVFLLLGVYWQM